SAHCRMPKVGARLTVPAQTPTYWVISGRCRVACLDQCTQQRARMLANDALQQIEAALIDPVPVQSREHAPARRLENVQLTAQGHRTDERLLVIGRAAEQPADDVRK